jgi:protein SCO1/2
MLVTATTLACAPHRSARDAPATGSAATEEHGPADGRAEPSLFELDFALTDAAGRERHLSEFAGQPLVLSMIYTSCKSVCPRTTADLRQLDRALPADLRARTRFVLFSLDPRRDTPAALAGFARENHLDARWTLLAASEDDMRTIAAVLGVRFRPDAGGEIAHSATIVVADGRGVIRHRQQGLGSDPAPLVHALREAR